MKFNFKAKTKEGELKEGVIEAASKEAAAGVLQRNGLFPMRISAVSESGSLSKMALKYYDRVLDKELVVFFRQLAILIEARVPIVVSLNAIVDQTANRYFQRVIKEMVNDIEDGMPFSNALEKHPDVFSSLTLNIIRAGEASGNLKKSIDYVANNIEKNYTLLQRVRSAMIYPSVILIVFFIIGFLVITFIMPKLTMMIKELEADIPWYTQVIISVGDFMSAYWWAVLIIIFGVVGGILYYIKTDEGKKEFDLIKLKLPVLGNLFRYIYIARFAENFGVLLVGGIPILRALGIVSSVINNSVYESIFLRAADEVKVGGNMSDVLKKSEFIPPMVAHMIKIGEDSGQVDSVLEHIAKFYDQETEVITKNLSTLIEPVLMVFIGIGVGFMAVGVLMPIYNIAGQIK